MRRIGSFALLVGLASLLCAALAAGWVLRDLRRPHRAWAGEAVVVELPAGLNAGAILDRLGGAGVIRHPRVVRAWLRLRGGSDELAAGEYRFDRPISALETLQRLRDGDVMLHPVTLPEGLTLVEVADRLVAAGLGEREALLGAFRDPARIRDWDPNASDLEGYLFPETYRFSKTATAEQIAATMVERFRRVVGPDYADRAAELGLDLCGAVTLASMIEKETGLAHERARISAVFHNRLRRGMRMECDPTVLYALERAGARVGRLSLRHLRFESPWNTYRVYGLPAGPIGNPGRASLDAAIRPAPGEELFFVAAPGGGHRFSRGLADHERAVSQWRAYLESSR